MRLTFAPKGILQIDEARIVFRNFSGRGDQYNREGDRNFALVIPDMELADELIKDRWNVKIREPRDEEDTPFIFLPVKVKFNDRGPSVQLVTGNAKVKLYEDTVSCLDRIDISSVDMDIRPYDWVLYEGTKNEKRGRTAYLQSIRVFQEVDRFSEDFDDPAEMPFR